MDKRILGIHHVTAIAGDPQQNLDFYNGFLGLRLVKQTVNYDDPETYHLYYGDKTGHPGTILTFFPWTGAPRGRRGTGQLTTISFSVPEESIGYWLDRFSRNEIAWEKPVSRFDEDVVTFFDPDGLQLQLVAHPSAKDIVPWAGGPVPERHAIRGFHGVTLTEEGYERTGALLKLMGFHLVRDDGDWFRYEVGDGGPGSILNIMCKPEEPRGIVSVGTVHHVAWRTPDDEEQHAWREDLVNAGLNVTPVIDRRYFHSIYFREPGGVLFEIATDPPGFMLDESVDELGSSLMLPPWLEADRNYIEQRLPSIHVPQISYI